MNDYMFYIDTNLTYSNSYKFVKYIDDPDFYVLNCGNFIYFISLKDEPTIIMCSTNMNKHLYGFYYDGKEAKILIDGNIRATGKAGTCVVSLEILLKTFVKEVSKVLYDIHTIASVRIEGSCLNSCWAEDYKLYMYKRGYDKLIIDFKDYKEVQVDTMLNYIGEKYEIIINDKMSLKEYLEKYPITYSYNNYTKSTLGEYLLINIHRYIEKITEDVSLYYNNSLITRLLINEDIEIRTTKGDFCIQYTRNTSLSNIKDIVIDLLKDVKVKAGFSFLTLKEYLNDTMANTSLEYVVKYMLNAHEGQTDKSGQPYFLHPMRVMSNLMIKHPHLPKEVYIGALLHDVVEDTSTTISEIVDEFGYRVGELVHLLSRKKGQSYNKYINLIKEDKEASLIKIEDLFDNSSEGRLKLLLDIEIESETKTLARVKKYKSTIKKLEKGLN